MTAPVEISVDAEDDFEPYDMLPTDPAVDADGEGEDNG